MTATTTAETVEESGSQPPPIESSSVVDEANATTSVASESTTTSKYEQGDNSNPSGTSGGGGAAAVHAGDDSKKAQQTSTPPDSAKNDFQDDGAESTYHLKWIQWNSGKIPIVMQSINGPCPLIATMNVLLLREKVKLPSMLEQITATQLLTYLGECIMDSVPADMENDENALLNLEQNIHDAMEILPKLKTGLDVNIRFTGITDFEYTPECIIFDLLRIPLYHGWLCDPNSTELQNAIGNQSYNQLVDNIITNKTSQDSDKYVKVLIAEEFLERTASQLTLHGLHELKNRIKDNEIGILFRNNHFLTLFKRESEIYTLVTDHGYLTEESIIWETLDNIEGAGRFLDSNFKMAEVTSSTSRQVSELNTVDNIQQQMEMDFLMALSIEAANDVDNVPGASDNANSQEDDFELAKRLQEEETRMYEKMMNESSAQQQQNTSSDGWPQKMGVWGVGGLTDDYVDEPNKSHRSNPATTHEQSSEAASSSDMRTKFDPLEATGDPYCPSELKHTQLNKQASDPSKLPLTPTSSSISVSANDPYTANQELLSSGQQQHQQQETLPDHQQPVNRVPVNGRRSRSEKNIRDSNCIIS